MWKTQRLARQPWLLSHLSSRTYESSGGANVWTPDAVTAKCSLINLSAHCCLLLTTKQTFSSQYRQALSIGCLQCMLCLLAGSGGAQDAPTAADGRPVHC